jgi:hypothetical protein
MLAIWDLDLLWILDLGVWIFPFRPPYRNSLRPAGGRLRLGGGAACATFGPVTVRWPTEVPQREQRNSCSSPEGRISRSRSRTGWDD